MVATFDENLNQCCGRNDDAVTNNKSISMLHLASQPPEVVPSSNAPTIIINKLILMLQLAPTTTNTTKKMTPKQCKIHNPSTITMRIATYQGG